MLQELDSELDLCRVPTLSTRILISGVQDSIDIRVFDDQKDDHDVWECGRQLHN